MLQSGNPVFNSGVYAETPGVFGEDLAASKPATMSVQGTAWKTLYLVVIAIVMAAASWNTFVNNPGAIMWACIGALITSLAAGFVILKMARFASYVVPIFACGEGVFLAAISVAVVKYSPLADKVFGGMEPAAAEQAALAMVGQAAGLTLSIALAMLTLYVFNIIRLRGVVGKIVIVMTAGVMLYYVGAFVINMIAGPVIPRLGWDAGPIGIGFSLFVVALASLNLVLDFQFVEDGVQRRLPKHMEWIAAFGLLTTLVWLYIEVLRLLAKLRGND